MATSYSNAYGTGDRRASIVFWTNANYDGTLTACLDGVTDGSGWPLVRWWDDTIDNTKIVKFTFPEAIVIDEAKYYQSDTSSNGVWEWQGSNDNSSWTTIGSSFTLGGATSQTITTLSGNTTAYVYYRLRGVSGTLTRAWFWEWEFKTEIPPSYVPLDITITDNLSNWADAAGGSGFSHLLEIEEDLNSWDDLLEVLLAVHLWEGGSGSWPIWHDSVSLALSGFLIASIADDLNNWGDATSNALQFAHSFGDTLSLDDAISLLVNIPLLRTDDLNNWQDAFEYLSAIVWRNGDSFRLSDRVQVAFQQGKFGADLFTLSDVIGISLSGALEATDILSMSDAVSLTLAEEISSVSVSDSLNYWQDFVSVYGTESEDDYYRRYLNDRLFFLGEQFESPTDTLTFEDSVEVELV